MHFYADFGSTLPKTIRLCSSRFFSRLIRPDAPAHEEDKSLAEQECPSSQERSAISLEPGEEDCSAIQDSAASSITSSNDLSLKETIESANGKALGASFSDADGTEASISERWEAGRAGSMAARLLRDVKVPST